MTGPNNLTGQAADHARNIADPLFRTQVKKFRKGQTDTIDFLEEGGGGKQGKKSNKKEQNQA